MYIYWYQSFYNFLDFRLKRSGNQSVLDRDQEISSWDFSRGISQLQTISAAGLELISKINQGYGIHLETTY